MDTSDVFFTISIQGEHLDPIDVSEATGLFPTKSYTKGNPKGNSNAIATHGLWEWRSPIKSESIRNHLMHLKDKLTGDINLSSVKFIEHAFIDILILSKKEHGKEYKIDLDVDSINILKKIGLPVELTYGVFD